MVSRRSQNSLTQDQPIRFYKFVALTFLLLTIILTAVVVFMSSKRATIFVTTKATPVDMTVEVSVGAEDSPVEGRFEKISVSAETVFTPQGTKEEVGTAKGVVTLHNDSARAQPLVATTRLLTDEGVLFRLEDGVTVPANGTIENVAVYADKEGSASDIGPENFIIPGLNAARQKEVYATSESSMRGGKSFIGVIDENDLELAREKLKTVFLAEAKKQVGEEEEYVLSVGTLETNSVDLLGKEVDEATLTGSGDVLVVRYAKDELLTYARKQLETRAIGDAELVRDTEDDPEVRLVSADAENNEATVSVFLNGFLSINPQSRQLDKKWFYGKTRDEVRRYLLSLDHVHKADVEFQPAWMRTVPHVHDHISVVVEEVQE